MAFAMSQLSANRSTGMRASPPKAGSLAGPVRTVAVRTVVPSLVQFPVSRPSRSSRGSLQVVASGAEDKVKSLDRKSRQVDLGTEADGRSDWANLLAVAGFAAYWFNKIQVDRLLLIKALAGVQLFTALVNLITRIGTLDKVTTIIGPATLAVFALNIQVSFLDTATALFGYYLAGQITGPFYLWVATLAAALYYGYGTLWYTVAFGVVALIKFVQAVRSEDRAPLLAVPAVVVSAWAVYTERHFVWSLLLYLAQAAYSAFGTVEKLTAKVED